MKKRFSGSDFVLFSWTGVTRSKLCIGLWRKRLQVSQNSFSICDGLISLCDGFSLSFREVIFQSSIANNCTGLFLTDRSFLENIKTILSYACILKKRIRVQVKEARAVDIAKDLQSSRKPQDAVLGHVDHTKKQQTISSAFLLFCSLVPKGLLKSFEPLSCTVMRCSRQSRK